MQRYGLQLRTKPAASSSRAPAPARPLAAFADDGDDDVEAEILRQAAKKRALQKVEEQQKKAMEEDPSVFAYDEVYDEMKEKAARPKMQDKVVRESKYIAQLKEKAEQRKREQDIIYERKLQKERSKEDHLFGDKDKFVTSAYRKKLEEQQKWLEEERKRQRQEEKEDVTKKKDLSDFYFGLQNNVAFGAQTHDNTKHANPQKSDNKPDDTKTSSFDAEVTDHSPKRRRESSVGSERAKSVEEPSANRPRDSTTAISTEKNDNVPSNASQTPQNTQPAKITDDHYKRTDDALAAARERALARKRAKEAEKVNRILKD
uniref:Pco097918 n=1 Tax=Arundo donax TaxID=35708 RepID=A0A0A8Y937_ARUDO